MLSNSAGSGFLLSIFSSSAVSLSTTTLIDDDGMKYAKAEIDYEPKFHEQRFDFEVPFRMFAEPVVG
jgi:hypothetical protein